MKSNDYLQKKLQLLAAQEPFSLELREGEGNIDFFEIEETEKGIRLTYANRGSGIYGIKRLSEARLLEDTSIFGIHRAKVPWRVLMPTFSPIESQFFESAVENGYNAVILNEEVSSIQEAHKWGLKVILKPHFTEFFHDNTPFDPSYKEHLRRFLKELREKFPFFQALYWESPYYGKEIRKHLLKYGKLRSEFYIAELLELEKLTPLFFALPESDLNALTFSDMARLEQHAGQNTWLPFSSYEGGANEISLKENPYFSLKKNRSIPILTYLEEEVALNFKEPLSRFFSQPLSGGILKISYSPKINSFSHANFYTAGKLLFQGHDPHDSMKNWLRLHRNGTPAEISLIDLFDPLLPKYTFLKRIERAQTISQEDLKIQIDELLPLLKRLEKAVDTERKRGFNTSQLFKELQDTLDKLLHLAKESLTKHQIPIPLALQSKNLSQ